MEFVSQIFPRYGLRTNRPCPRRKIWETFFEMRPPFPGTKIFPQKMFPQLDLSLTTYSAYFQGGQELNASAGAC
jgi:hypothetical protein